MKKIFSALVPLDILLTACPGGYTTINEPYITLTSEDTCPDGTQRASGADSVTTCNNNIYGDDTRANLCYLYLPSNTPIRDLSGTYEYKSLCPLE